jgi:hypothetical protein
MRTKGRRWYAERRSEKAGEERGGHLVAGISEEAGAADPGDPGPERSQVRPATSTPPQPWERESALPTAPRMSSLTSRMMMMF